GDGGAGLVLVATSRVLARDEADQPVAAKLDERAHVVRRDVLRVRLPDRVLLSSAPPDMLPSGLLGSDDGEAHKKLTGDEFGPLLEDAGTVEVEENEPV